MLLFECLLFHFLNFSFELDYSPFQRVSLCGKLWDLHLFCLHFWLQNLCIVRNTPDMVLVPSTSSVVHVSIWWRHYWTRTSATRPQSSTMRCINLVCSWMGSFCFPIEARFKHEWVHIPYIDIWLGFSSIQIDSYRLLNLDLVLSQNISTLIPNFF